MTARPIAVDLNRYLLDFPPMEEVPEELQNEVNVVVETLLYEGWREEFAGGMAGISLLRLLDVAPGYSVRLHPTEPCAEFRAWRQDGSGLPLDRPVVRIRRTTFRAALCGVLVLAATLTERRGLPAPLPLLAAATRLLAGGYAEVVG